MIIVLLILPTDNIYSSRLKAVKSQKISLKRTSLMNVRAELVIE